MGHKAATKSKGLVELSKCSEHHSERDVHVVTERFQLSLPVKISTLKKTPGVRYCGEISVIRLRDWCEFLVNYNVWHVMLGLYNPDRRRERCILKEFWRRFKILKPDHQIWGEADKHKVDMSRCLPVALHGDEGRGRKRGPFLVVAYHSLIGFGTQSSNHHREKKEYLQMRLNYTESSHVTRMLTAVLPKMGKDEQALNDILEFVTEDSFGMVTDGVMSKDGERFYMANLQCTGDWVWLQKAGSLSRSFANVEKRPRAQNAVPKGICHWCRAGQLDYPFEDFRAQPRWQATMFDASDSPFTKTPVLLRLPHEPTRPSAYFTFDLWHAWHLGLGKTYVASVFALLSDTMQSSNIDARFAELTDLFLQWCDDTRTTAFVSSITKESIGWPDRGTYPNGMWSKGHVTTTFMRFISWYFATHDVTGNYMLNLCVEATFCANSCFELLYRNDLWLTGDVSREVGRLGLRFLDLYQQLARHAFDRSCALWVFMPKSHICHHTWLECSLANEWLINPLAFAVQISEDYVGKKSRLARRVAPGQAILRVVQRTLKAGYKLWCEAGFLKG